MGFLEKFKCKADKKSKENRTAYEMGVFIEAQNVENNFKNRKTDFIVEFLLNYIGIWAAAAMFLSAFNIEYSESYMFYMFIVLLSIVFVMKKFDRKNQSRLLVIFAVIFVAVSIMLNEFIICSAAGLVNQMNIGIEYDKVISHRFILIYAAVVMAALMALFIYKGRRAYTLIFPLGIIAVCVIFNRFPSSFSVMLTFIFILNQGICKKTGNTSDELYYPCAVAVSVFILYVIISVFVPERSYKGENIWENICRLFEKEIEDDFYEPYLYLGVGGENLGSTNGREYTDIKVMSFKTGYSGTMYLRGFIGSTYENNSWYALPESIYDDYKAVFDKSKYNIDIYNQTSKLFSIIDSDSELIEEFSGGLRNHINNVLIRDYSVNYERVLSREYWYMPYGNVYYTSKKSEADGCPVDCEDGAIFSKQYIIRNMDYDSIKSLIDNYNGSSIKLTEYIEWEKGYRKFVCDAYTRIDDEVNENIKSVFLELKDNLTVKSEADKLKVAYELKKYFQENFTYTLMPGAVPDGEDLVDYFLNDTRTGYCTYFASAAVQLLRKAGIPARYAEGFIVNPQDSAYSVKEKVTGRENDAYSLNEKYTEYNCEVFDRNAHAWAEIYIDGYGWLPVEVTPGYEQMAVSEGEQIEGVIEEKADEAPDEVQTEVSVSESDDYESDDLYFEESYSSLKEYLRKNRTGILDFSIVFSILWNDFLKLLIKLVYIAAVFFIIGICFYIPAAVSEKKKNYLFVINEGNTPSDDNSQVLQLFNYLDKVCRFLKIKRTSGMSYASYCEAMKEYSECFTKAGVENIIYSIEKISFGRGNIGKKEMQRTVEAAAAIRKEIYGELNYFQKLLYRYVWHLY